MPRRSLGKGLSELLAGANMAATRAVIDVELDRLQPNPYQPRRVISEEALAELTDSIREQGVLQPLLVREIEHGYQIVAGERRWRAARLLELATVPCLVHQFDDSQTLQVALIENLQRDDLNPIEQARAFRQLIEEFGMTQEELSSGIGKSRSAVANCLRLLSLPLEIQEGVEEGALSEGHARALLALRDEPGLLYQATEQIVREDLNVRQTEKLVRKISERAAASPEPTPPSSAAPDPHLVSAVDRLQEALATRVRIARKAQGGGTIRITYHDDEELSRLLDVIAPDVGL